MVIISSQLHGKYMGPGEKTSDGGRFQDAVDSLFDGRDEEDEVEDDEEEE